MHQTGPEFVKKFKTFKLLLFLMKFLFNVLKIHELQIPKRSKLKECCNSLLQKHFTIEIFGGIKASKSSKWFN